MHRIANLLAAAGLVLALAGSASAIGVGAPAPDFGGTWKNHESATLASLRGHVVLVEFWRTW